MPFHQDLKYAGALPPLDAPHHLRATEWGTYREGVVRRSLVGVGSWVDVGLDKVGALELGGRGVLGGCGIRQGGCTGAWMRSGVAVWTFGRARLVLSRLPCGRVCPVTLTCPATQQTPPLPRPRPHSPSTHKPCPIAASGRICGSGSASKHASHAEDGRPGCDENGGGGAGLPS